MIAVGKLTDSEAVNMGNRNHERRTIAAERGNTLVLDEKGGGPPLEARRKGCLKMKDEN